MNLMLPRAREPKLSPASRPRRQGSERLLVIDPSAQRFADASSARLATFFAPGDLLVVNDAATLPAALRAENDLELRLVAAEPDATFRAVSFGAGDHYVATELRAEPRALALGEELQFAPDLRARVVDIDASEPRLVRLRFDHTDERFWSALYRVARPIQYAYLASPLALWDVQNRYASRPWAFELPSAGHPLTFDTLFEIERRGAAVSYVTHAAGISSTGSSSLDARFPLREHYEVSAAASAALRRTRDNGGRVIAAGTSVVRALESSVDGTGTPQAGSGYTDLLVSASSALRVVDGLLTGLHEPGTSHFSLLEAFAPRQLLLRALEHAARAGYLQHEFGDSCLILTGALH